MKNKILFKILIITLIVYENTKITLSMTFMPYNYASNRQQSISLSTMNVYLSITSQIHS